MGLYRRDRVWWMNFIYHGEQVRRSTETTNKKVAQKIEAKIKADWVEGKWLDIDPTSKTSFYELGEKYLAERSFKKDSVSRKRDRAMSKHLLKFFGGLKLSEVSPKRISAYKVKRYKDRVKPATINRELSFMKHAFTIAIKEWELCRDNPVKRVSMERENNARDNWLTFQEEERLLRHCETWLQELIVFATNTGMRMGEILSLIWKNVDLNRGVARSLRAKTARREASHSTVPYRSFYVISRVSDT